METKLVKIFHQLQFNSSHSLKDYRLSYSPESSGRLLLERNTLTDVWYVKEHK